MAEEKVLVESRPSFIILIPHIILLFVIVGFFTIWKPLAAVLKTRIRVTDKKVEASQGLLKKETMDSALDKITSVKIKQSLLGRILKYGTVNINTASGNYAFDYIHDPDAIRKAIAEVTDI